MTRFQRRSDARCREKRRRMLCSSQPSFPTFTIAVLISCLLPSFGSSLSLSSKLCVPSEPCLDFAKRSGTNGDIDVVAAVASASGVHCPRYHPGVFDGRVCIGCFRDDYEIANWDSFSFAEKAYALEDASDRAQAKEVLEGNEYEHPGSIPVEELKRQASFWRALAAKASKGANSTWKPNESFLKEAGTDIEDQADLTDTAKSNQNLKLESFVASEATIQIASTVTVSTDAPTIAMTSSISIAETTGNSGKSTIETPNTGLPIQQKEEEQQQEQQFPPPPTPCTRICRYNANCYDGEVCIGCFRDTHDIAQWSSMSCAEKMFSLEDAADRCRDLSEKGKDTETCFEGGISEAVLRDQATLWSVWKG